MSTKYPQGVITATPPFQSTTAQSFSGVWTLEQLGKNYFYYQQPVAKSLRFRSSASAYLSRTPSTGGNRTTWTWSGWVKRGSFANAYTMFGSRLLNSSTPYGYLSFDSSDIISWNGNSSDTLNTTPVYRDPSSWYHIVFAVDTTQTTSTDRLKLYVNGTQITSFTTASYPAQNASLAINAAQTHWIGCVTNGIGTIVQYFDGYMGEVNFIDGQALDPSYFGQLSTITGVWSPKKYVGSYGGNGFYLPFTDATSTTTLGYDYSGNSNNWTTNNISLTSGSTYDSMWDSPTSYDNGVNGVGNYAVLNPLDNGGITVADGNLTCNQTGGDSMLRGSFGVSSGKWYWEATLGNTKANIGIAKSNAALSSYLGSDANGWGYYSLAGTKVNSGATTAYGATYTTGDVIGVAFDADAGTLTFYKNNVSQGVAFTGLTSGPYFPAQGTSASLQYFNFGQRPFAYTPPTGFKALNTQNLPAVSIANGANHMAASLFTGNNQPNESVLNSYNSVGFQPDFVWMKSRSNSQSNYLVDSVRGGSSLLRSDTTGAESTGSVWIQSFDASGFTATNNVLSNGYTYVGWNWKAGGTAVTNTAGSITSSVSANPTAGFSVVTYTGTGANATVGHGLGVAPSMVIVKNRATAATSWIVYHASLSNTQALYLNTTDAVQTSNLFWNNTSPTSSVFSVAAYNPTNQASTNIVAYCFAAIPGYSAFGSYTGNGSANGPFVYCGFRPRFVLIKCSSTGGTYYDWAIFDTSRAVYNVIGPGLYADSSGAEFSGTYIDILSNGFKTRDSSTTWNQSSQTYIYACFAENPFKYSLAR